MNKTLRRGVAAACLVAGVSVLTSCANTSGNRASSGTTPRTNSTSSRGVASTVQNPEFLRQWAETYRFSAGRPKSVKITPDGSAVLFLRSGPRSAVQDLFQFDAATGTERVLLTADQILAGSNEELTPEELARRERLRMSSRGISGFSLNEDGSTLLVPLSGKLYLVDRASGKIRSLQSKAGSPQDASFSPDGRFVACVRADEVFVTNVTTGEERQITTGAGGTITHGTAEFVAQEEMDRREGYWWSPDGSMIAYQETDTAGMETFSIADAMKPEKRPQSWPYPRAGGVNASVRLGVVPTTGGNTVLVEWDRAAFPYMAAVTWKKDAPLTVLVQNREQTHEKLLAVDPATGRTTVLLEERDSAWINLFNETPSWLPEGRGFLWISEKSGWATLELRGRDGQVVRELCGRDIGLQGLIGVQGDAAYVAASPEPAEVHVYRVPLAGGLPERLSMEMGVHGVTLGKDGTRVRSLNLFDGTNELRVERADGSAAGVLRSTAEEPSLPTIELASVTDLNIRAVVIRPRGFEQGKKYPVIVSVYGGPHSNTVNASPRGYVLQQWMADQGFIVVTLDGRGTPRRGRGWERAIKNDLSKIPLADQKAGVLALCAQFPEMDSNRIGIYGWSFGGYFSAMATMREPGVYKAGIAGAPVADWVDYDTHYTERYMGLPSKNKAGYDAANVLTYCKDLSVPLLVAHGTADDNVYFVHGLKMADAMIRSGREFEFMPLAGFTHMVAEPEMVEKMWTRFAAFFIDELSTDND